MTRHVAVVSAGLSQPSSTRLLADRLTAAVARDLADRGDDLRVTVVELRDLAHDITNAVLTGFAAPDLQDALVALSAADAVIAVTPTFNASYSGLFKCFFDVLEQDALADTPVLLGATGGTERHSLVLEHAMRPLFSYLGAHVVPVGVYAASTDWGQGDDAEALARRIARAAAQLVTAVLASSKQVRTDGFDDLVPFGELLGRTSTAIDAGV
ncbi:MAG: NAD(P)H-dependent oxidoreductase [Actinomycetota bacterium]|nr:NAD(P)H-dependent oxidoreductase [Actinomycetota bacterium]